MNRTGLFGTSALVLAGSLFVALGTGSAHAADAAAMGAKSNTLEELVVTAQRREQRLEDVPVAVTALGQSAIERRGIADFDTYLRQVPSAQFVNQGSQGTEVKFRGVGNGTAQLSPTTAVYLGDVPVIHTGRAVNSSYNFALIDMNRVEVLRGPQGQLFGANSLGGAIRNIPNAVKLSGPEFQGSVTGSSTEHASGSYALDVTANLPLSEDFGVRLTGYTSVQSGWYTNVYNGGPQLASLVHPLPPVPPQVLANAPGFLLSRIIAANPAVGAYSAPANHESNDTDVSGARLMARWHPNDRLDVNLMLAYETKKTSGPNWAINIPNVPGALPNSVAGPVYAVPFASDARKYQYSDSGPVATHDKIFVANLVADYDLQFAKLTSSTAFWDRTEKLNTDVGAISWLATGEGETFPYEAQRNDHPKSYSQEFRLTSEGQSKLNWLGGVFFQRIDQHFTQAAVDLSGLDIFYTRTVIQAGLLGRPGPTTTIPSLQTAHFIDDQEAVFGQLSYEFVPTLTADVSFRAFNLQQSASTTQVGFTFVGQGQFAQKNKVQVFTPKATLSWKPSDDQLLYLTAAEGYRTGIINFAVPTPACAGALSLLGAAAGAQNLPPTSPDTLWNYEAGAKAEFNDHRIRVNAAAYHINWKNLQSQVLLASLAGGGGVTGGCTSLQVVNVGDATIDGAELEATFLLTKQLSLEVSASETHPTYDNNIPALHITSGSRIQGTPQSQAYVALQYQFDLGSRPAFLRGEYSYTGKIGTAPTDFVTQRAPFKTGDFAEVNLRGGVSLNDKLDVTVFVTNLFDKYGVTGQTDIGGQGSPTDFTIRPRTVGATLRARF